MSPLFRLIAIASTISLAFALPSSRKQQSCLTACEGTSLATRFADLVGNYTAEKADTFLLVDYQDYSDGINSLQQKPLGSVTFAGREAFKAAQEGHGGTPMVVDTVVATTCDTVVWTWTATFGEAAKSARGINIVKFVEDDGAWWVERVDMEMNSLVYLEDLGGTWSLPAQ
ncbi:putative SnoaL-like domain-containing protein [Seiridium cardinale]|uniref:SnoaL-like domain-containing protein n=1 Tax=Seiridium cardinale TaxID=138064 RepID=A0ABR2Y7B5_9PEZI